MSTWVFVIYVLRVLGLGGRKMKKSKVKADDANPQDGFIPQEVVDHLGEHFPEHDPVELVGRMREAMHAQWRTLRNLFH
jgi:hypothetical protein